MSIYESAVPAFLQILGSLQGVIAKAEAHCETRKIKPEVLFSARLYPDMLPFSAQIQIASDFAGKTCARLTGNELPVTPDTEQTFAELRARLAKTASYVKGYQPAQFEGAETREIRFNAGPNNPVTMSGQRYLSHFALPNFYFHATTAHDILRHNGVEIGKRDFLGLG